MPYSSATRIGSQSSYRAGPKPDHPTTRSRFTKTKVARTPFERICAQNCSRSSTESCARSSSGTMPAYAACDLAAFEREPRGSTAPNSRGALTLQKKESTHDAATQRLSFSERMWINLSEHRKRLGVGILLIGGCHRTHPRSAAAL